MAETHVVQFCSAALIQLGESPLEALEQQGSAALVARTWYGIVRDDLLGGHPWSFNRKIVALSRRATAPAESTGFDAAYVKPSDMWKVRVVHVDGYPSTSWDIDHESILLSATTSAVVELEYHTLVDEEVFPPYFRSALVARLAAEMCLAITNDLARRKELMAHAMGLAAIARHQASQERPGARIRVGALGSLRG